MSMPEGERFVNRKRHICGCVTHFDTEFWQSEIVKPCETHASDLLRSKEQVK
jgi:hypothetical protein